MVTGHQHQRREGIVADAVKSGHWKRSKAYASGAGDQQSAKPTGHKPCIVSSLGQTAEKGKPKLIVTAMTS